MKHTRVTCHTRAGDGESISVSRVPTEWGGFIIMDYPDSERVWTEKAVNEQNLPFYIHCY